LLSFPTRRSSALCRSPTPPWTPPCAWPPGCAPTAGPPTRCWRAWGGSWAAARTRCRCSCCRASPPPTWARPRSASSAPSCASCPVLSLSPLLVLLAADARAPPHLPAVRTQAAPVIDGRLDNEAWKAAIPTSAFTQQVPFDGQPPSEKTTLRVLYDDQAI